MATVKQLVINFTLNAQGVQQALQAIQKQLGQVSNQVNNFNQQAQQTNKGINSIASGFRALTSALTVVTAALGAYALIKKSVDQGNLAKAIGANANDIRATSNYFEQLGLSASEAESAISEVATSINNFKYAGQSSNMFDALQFFLGTDVALDENISEQEKLLRMGEKAVKFYGSEKAALAALGAQFKLNTKMMSAFTREGARAELREQEKLAKADEARQKSLSELNKVIVKNKKIWQELITEALAALAPHITDLLKYLNQLLKNFLAQPDAADKAKKALIVFTIAAVLPAIGKIARLATGLINLGGAFTKLGPLIHPQIALLAAFVIGAKEAIEYLDKSRKKFVDENNAHGINMVDTGNDFVLPQNAENYADPVAAYKNPSTPAALPKAKEKGERAGEPVFTGGDRSAKQAHLRALEDYYKLPRGLLDAVWAQESNRGDPNWMLSEAGAKGDFQFIDSTAAQYGVDVNSFSSSASGAARMYRDLLRDQKGDLRLALASYNWGIGNVNSWKETGRGTKRIGNKWVKGMGTAMPSETINYMDQIIARMARNGGGGGDVIIQNANFNGMPVDNKNRLYEEVKRDNTVNMLTNKR